MNSAGNMAETPYSCKQSTRVSTLPYGTDSYEPIDVDVINIEPTEIDAIYVGPKSDRGL